MKRLFAGMGIAALLSGVAFKTGLPQRLRRVFGGADSLNDLTKEELYKRAQDANIPGRSDMTKDELAAALKGQSGN